MAYSVMMQNVVQLVMTKGDMIIKTDMVLLDLASLNLQQHLMTKGNMKIKTEWYCWTFYL